MRVLLIGANGYLGRFVADRLLADPAVQLTALGRGDDADVRFDLATGSPGALTRFLDAVHPGVVINCAGATRGGARELTRHNTVAVATVCEALRRSRSGCGPGWCRSGAARSTARASPVPQPPRTPYPAPAARTASANSPPPNWSWAPVSTPSSCASSHPRGPAPPRAPPLGRLAEAMRRAMQSGDGELKLGGLGAQRDFVDVRDVARAVHAASLSAAQGVINIGSGRAVRLRDAAAVLARVAGYGGALHELDGPPGPLRAAIGHPRTDPDHAAARGRVPVPGRLRELAAGRCAHRARPARLAAPDQPGGVPRRHLDGGGMPHLTSATPGTASTSVRTGFGVPGYAHPLVAPTEWGELTRPGTPLHWVVLNVSSGPGTRPDPHCLEAAGRLSNAGVRVLGHLDAAHGTRAFGDLISEAHRYRDWYRVDGFLLERCPTDASSSRRYAARSPRCASSGTAPTSSWGTAPIRTPDTPSAPTSW